MRLLQETVCRKNLFALYVAVAVSLNVRVSRREDIFISRRFTRQRSRNASSLTYYSAKRVYATCAFVTDNLVTDNFVT